MGQAIRMMTAAESALGLVQREYPQYHPLVALARMAHREDVIADPKLELDVHKTILPYVQPKLASIEVKQVNQDDRRVIVSLFDEATLADGSQVDVERHLAIEDATEVVPLDAEPDRFGVNLSAYEEI